MTPFPEKHDLLAFFECEPIIKYDDSPWFYNHLTYTINRGEDRIVCEIEPGDEILKFQWFKNDDRIVCLDLNWVSGLKIETKKESEAMIATFRDKNLVPLRIQLRPNVSISWGINPEPI